MSEWSFLFSRRWVGYLALTIVFAVVCCCLGVWQFARRAEALAEVARIEGNYDASPVPITQALPSLESFEEKQKWTPVALVGSYLSDEEVYVRNRPLNGATGFEVITPFRLTDGGVVMVDRGWIPTASDRVSPSPVTAAPSGVISIIGRLKAGEPPIGGRTASGNTIPSIDLTLLAERVGDDSYTGAYALLAGSPGDGYPTPVGRPAIDEGPHLSYALQWFVFALLGFIALAWAANQERKNILADAAPVKQPGSTNPSGPQPGSRRRTDAEIEDSILDSH